MNPTNGAGPHGRGVDLDMLADYLEGVLSEAETRTVGDLVANDPVWAATYAALAGAQPAVHASIAGYAASAEPLPPAFGDRITEALREARRRETVRAPASLDAARKRRHARQASHTWVRIAVAASVIGIVGLGAAVSLNGMHPSAGSKATSATQDGRTAVTAPEASGARPQVPSGTLLVSASGRNYTAQTLGARAGQPSATTTFGLTGQGAPAPLAISGDLSRLTAPAALEACLSAIVAAHGGTPKAVDYAAYAGHPALVVTLAGANLVVAVAGQCGQPGIGADEIASAPQR